VQPDPDPDPTPAPTPDPDPEPDPDPDPDPVDPAPCLDRYFSLYIAPTIRGRCSSCHVAAGRAGESDLIFAEGWEGFPSDIEALDRQMINTHLLDAELRPRLLEKMAGERNHGGGVPVPLDSAVRSGFEGYAALLDGTTICDEELLPALLTAQDLILASNIQTLRTTHRLISDQLPDDEQLVAVQGDDQALALAITDLLDQEPFFERIANIYEDMLLTQTNRSGANSIWIMRAWGMVPTSSGEIRGNYRWMDDFETPQSPEWKAMLYGSAYGVSQAPKELVKHILRESHDFGEILTATYTLVNAYSARSYDVVGQLPANLPAATTGEVDRHPFVPVQLPVPSAGLLSDLNLLSVYPTDSANLNRNRSREINDHFLDRDILGLTTRTAVSFESTNQNPTWDDQACIVCHIRLDPIAGAYQNWPRVEGRQGVYDPAHDDAQDRWNDDHPDSILREPGLEADELLPLDRQADGLHWLAEQIVADPRFAMATARTLFEGLTHRDSLRTPLPETDNFLVKSQAWRMQRELLEAAARSFSDNGRDYQQLALTMLLSPLLRAADSSFEDQQMLTHFGVRSMPHGRELQNRLIATTGRAWTNYVVNLDGESNRHWGNDTNAARSMLIDYREACGNGGNGCYARYWGLLGGIDVNPTGGHARALTSPNVVITAIHSRMSIEMAWRLVARDFSFVTQDADGLFLRRLFPHVDLDTVPEDETGADIPTAQEAIRANIVFLHKLLLEEELTPDDPEVDATFALFLDVWRAGNKPGPQLGLAERVEQAELDANQLWRADQGLPALQRREVTSDTWYTIRAWRIVLDYLLSDYRFLYEHNPSPQVLP
jgi:hypothetical protein